MEKERAIQRLSTLETQLQTYYDKLHFHEERLPKAETSKQEFAHQAEINDARKKIQQLEREYSATITSIQQSTPVPEEIAIELIGDIQEAFNQAVEQNQLPASLLTEVRAIREKLEEPDKAASAKLKVSIPIIPTIASYELEADTEGVFTEIWKKIKSLLGSDSNYIQTLNLSLAKEVDQKKTN